ncbi:hypothetical protein CC86DRAFT_442318 [Ophiobolus disseminans]|uniref:RNI-like protein n=1 Tax=Ophiobolus disseminans TaxID=1469910 RepID=A0A6A7AG32_9PLEO|nr:hypothetical protein CC86DRAFT_442318 [Ophiobolus disseminans]
MGTRHPATAMANRHIVSLILHHLSDMKYKDRRQGGPDQPVEFLEFRPTLVPSILVNKLWADVSISILWKRYPHLLALKSIPASRRQWYADRVERVFIVSPPPDDAEDLAYLEDLVWPSLKNLELEIDWQKHGNSISRMLHASLEHLEFSGEQSGGSKYIAETVLPALLDPCKFLQSIRIGPDMINSVDAIHSQVLANLLTTNAAIRDIRIMNANFIGNNKLFEYLTKRSNLEVLEIDLDPGLQLLPFFAGAQDLFRSLRKLHVMCYPETACALPAHLPSIEELSLDIARVPDQSLQGTDFSVLDDLLKVNIGQLALDFPSATSLPFLNGTSLIELATACPQLKDLTLLASEPAAINGSKISSAQFGGFCRRAPNLVNLSLKLHPGTNLAKHCHNLEVLRLKISLQLPLLPTSSAASGLRGIQDSPFIQASQKDDYIEIKAFATHTTASVQPLFPSLVHLALARPQSVLSVTADTYAASSISQASSEADPLLEEDLLDILEAWGDWTGHDNDSLNYFLPREEPLASTWEFLSGIEQDLWEDGASNGDDRFADDGDWDRASLVNEFPEDDDYGNGEYLHAYDDEPEDMNTPVDERQAWYKDSKAYTRTGAPGHI